MKVKAAVVVLAGLASVGIYDSVLHAQSVKDGIYTNEQADRGKSSYSRECAVCHGAELGGGDVPPALIGDAFLNGYPTVGDLFERIRNTMPANEKVGKLSRDVNADITAFILRSNGYAAGATPLSSKTEILSAIKMEPK